MYNVKMNFPYITMYSSFEEVHSVFIKVNKKYDNAWDIPYARVENAIRSIVDSYRDTNQLFRRGPGEFKDIIWKIANT